MFKRQWLTFKLSTLFLIVTAAAVLFGYPHIWRQIQFQRFKGYLGQDIRKLSVSEQESFAGIVNDLVPDSPRGLLALLGWRENWFVWQLPTRNGPRFVLFQAEPLRDESGPSEARLYFFDEQGRLVGQSSISTGWRIDITDAAIVPNEIDNEFLIAVSTEPGIGGVKIAKQYYAILNDSVVLLRLEDSTRAYRQNCYAWPNHTIGPATIARAEGEWIEALKSSDTAEVLRTLTWLGGRHHRPDRNPGNVLIEEYDHARLHLNVRTHPETRLAINALTKNAHPWISEAALQTQQVLREEP